MGSQSSSLSKLVLDVLHLYQYLSVSISNSRARLRLSQAEHAYYVVKDQDQRLLFQPGLKSTTTKSSRHIGNQAIKDSDTE